MAIRVFCDESYDSKLGTAFVYSALFGKEENWVDFEYLWNQKLKIHNLPDLHWSDCVQGAGNFKMPTDQRKSIQQDFIGLLRVCPFFAISIGIKMEDFTPLRPAVETFFALPQGSPVSGDMTDPYFYAFWCCAGTALDKLNHHLEPSEPVAFCFDQHHRAANAEYCFANIQSRLGKTRAISHAFGDRRVLVSLQAADVLAYESFRFFESCFLGGRKPRWQWDTIARLLGAEGVYYWDKEDCRIIFETIHI